MTGPAHTAVVHSTNEELVEVLVPYVLEGLAAGDVVQVNLVDARLEALEVALGPHAGSVAWSDTARWQASPGRRLRALEDALSRARRSGARMRFIGECAWPEAPEALVTEWERFDAVLNGVLATEPVEMVCVYDAATLPAAVVEGAARTHPQLGLAPPRPNPGFLDPETLAAALVPRALPLPEGAVTVVAVPDPPAARAFVRSSEVLAGLADDEREDLLVVVSELVTNAGKAGARSVVLACWRAPHGVILQVDDDGRGLDAPLAGYRRPSLDALSGRGLWITRQLTDAVEIASSPDGTSVRVHLVAQ